MNKYRLLFVAIFLLACVLRLFLLGRVPSSITDDEAAYIYSSYSIAKTGYDLAGKFLPLSINLDSSLSPVPVYLMIPFITLFDLSPFSGRLIVALLGIGSVILVYFLSFELFKNKFISLACMLLFSISPWHLLLSRSAYEGVVALFFYLLALVIFLKTVERGNILWSLPPFLLGFYSYHGTKIFFIFLIPLLLIVYKSELLKRKKELTFFIFGIVFRVLSFLFVVRTQNVTRQNVLIWNSPTEAKNSVDWEREKSIGSLWLRSIFSNKITYYFKFGREYYFDAFSPGFLFTKGDISRINAYGTFYRGELYFFELPLLICGLVFLLAYRKKKSALFVIGILLIAPIPSAIATDRTYIIRSIPLVPFLEIVSACGAFYLFDYTKHLKYQKLIIGTGIFVVCLFFIEYLYYYYFQFGLWGGEYWYQSSKDIVNYINTNYSKYDKIQLVAKDNNLILQYAFYEKSDPKEVSIAYFATSHKQIGNVEFLTDCNYKKIKDIQSKLAHRNLYIADDSCNKDTKPSEKIMDNLEALRTVWKIYYPHQ